MSRLVDYFAVYGFDFDKTEPPYRGKLLAKVPEQEWKDDPFTQGLHVFCQPTGWELLHEQVPPKFYVSVLTDEKGLQRFCAVLSFAEPVQDDQIKNNTDSSPAKSIDESFNNSSVDTSPPRSPSVEEMDDIGESEDSKENSNKLFAPKCILLLSKHQDFQVLKNCLGLIYTVYIENLSVSLELILGNLLSVQVTPRGTPMVRFSIGAADKQVIQPPQFEELPITRATVSVLLKQLGILNVLNILCAVLVDQKVLFYSCSFSRLTDTCLALTALMFPFKYSYPFIPILPKELLECTSSPTPFLIGVHSCLKEELRDLLDVVTVDLDGGVISIPECITIPMIPEPFYSRVVEALTKVLCPDLMVADYAYPPEQIKSLEPERLDKEIRAIFLRMFSQILMGYRTCLQVVRVHPHPIIRFQKDLFMSFRGFDKMDTTPSHEFISKLLDSQAFTLFIQEQGPPFRKLSIFDQTVADMPEQTAKEAGNMQMVLRHTKDIAYELYRNEYPAHTVLSQRVPKPSDGAYLRENQKPFPSVSPTAVQTFMKPTTIVNDTRTHTTNKRRAKKVETGNHFGLGKLVHRDFTASNRRLEVLRNCVSFIFESKTLEIKKIFHAVLRAMKSRAARHTLSVELSVYSRTRPQLDTQQFDYMERLINSAIENSMGQADEYTIASDFLPILSTFYRKLSPTVVQFMYTVVDQHIVWTSYVFWEFAFFSEIQSEICNLYQLLSKKKSPNKNGDKEDEESNQRDKRDNSLPMEICAKELQESVNKSASEREEMCRSEEGVIVGRTMHTAQRMIFMLVPLTGTLVASRVRHLKHPNAGNERGLEGSSSNSFITNSLADSLHEDSEDEEEALGGRNEVVALITKFVSRFIDRACTEAGISASYTKSLMNKIQPMVQMQFESLQDVFVESKRLPPVKKAKLLEPKLLPAETSVLQEPLRAFLVTDGRAVGTGGKIGGPVLLTSEGAVFVTNYRLIFIGTPCDALASEQVVIRSFPTSALYKAKAVHKHEHSTVDKHGTHGVILRSTTFQLLVLAFHDDDVTEEQRTVLLGQLNSLRYPATIHDVFALRQIEDENGIHRSYRKSHEKGRLSKDKPPLPENTRSKKGGAKTFMRQAKRKAGQTLGKQQRISRLVTDGKAKTIYMPAFASPQTKRASGAGEQLQEMNEVMTKTLSDKNTIERLHDRACKHDYTRIGITTHGNFRVSEVNRMFGICRSYPAYVVVPRGTSDEALKSLAHCHHQNRFPCVVWMHPKTHALLVRAASIKSRTLTTLFKHHLSDEGTIGSASVEEKFLTSLLPTTGKRPDSELFTSAAMEEVRGSNGVHKPLRKWGTLSARPASREFSTLDNRMSVRSSNNGLSRASAPKAQMYVFGDKSSIKNVRPEQQGLVEFIPLDLPEPKAVRTSFKAVLKACLPVDLPPPTQDGEQVIDDLFRRDVEETGWLQHLCSLLNVCGAIVDLIDMHGASCMIALEDGWDVTCQISALVQLLMDPYYRTITGFQMLLQKEWLSFGHRFAHRSLFNENIASGYTPLFLQFLDAVYQVLHQFPMSFEFNDVYLLTIAYHFSSNRFTTFLLDSDYERLEAGILFGPDKKKSGAILSLWKYLDLANERSPIFLNPLYGSTNLTDNILRPVSTLCRMKIWPYFVKEALGEGPIYDGLLGELSTGADIDQDTETTEAKTARRVVNSCYDNIQEVQPDSIKALLQRIGHLQADIGSPRESWKQVWNAACSASPNRRKVPTKTMEARLQLTSLHKKTTIETITRRNLAREDSDNISMASSEVSYSPSGVDYDTASLYEQTTSNAAEVRTYEGHLWKRGGGAMVKGWKRRFFVLDTTKHQLRQYESKLDDRWKRIIDLKEVSSVSIVTNVSNPPKVSAEQTIIELSTSKRSFHFIADDAATATIWIDNIQSALQG